jgi:hypothetical protein
MIHAKAGNYNMKATVTSLGYQLTDTLQDLSFPVLSQDLAHDLLFCFGFRSTSFCPLLV